MPYAQHFATAVVILTVVVKSREFRKLKLEEYN